MRVKIFATALAASRVVASQPRRPEGPQQLGTQVSLTFASWNRIARVLRQLDGLRGMNRVDPNTPPRAACSP